MPTDGSSVTDWITAISQLVFMIIFLMLFLGFNQRFQVFIWSRNIKARLGVLENLARESRVKTIEKIRSLRVHAGKNSGGVSSPENRGKTSGETREEKIGKHEKISAGKEPEGNSEVERVVDELIDYFVITPVDIEPTDIIRRMDTLFKTREERFEGIIKTLLPNNSPYERSLVETALEISIALNFVYKIVRHLLLTGQKMNNWILIMQLEMMMPLIMRQATTYRKALDVFLSGKPIGDGIGPLVAHYLAKGATPREIVKDTVVYETKVEGRKAYIIKARGPESNVGHPGKAVEALVRNARENGEKIGMIITVDAALKLEGEKTGVVAEGVGAAIGDPGPEKIRIERAAADAGVPLHAIVIKMSMEEAILEMRKEIAEQVERVIERIKDLVRTLPEDRVVIISGIGNTLGIA